MDPFVRLKLMDAAPFVERLRSGAPLQPVEIIKPWDRRYFLPGVVIFNLINGVFRLVHEPVGHSRWFDWLFLALNLAALVVVLFNLRSRLRITETGIEIRSGLRSRHFSYATISPFALRPRKDSTSVDVMFDPPDGAPPVRLRGYDVIERDLFELLSIYRARSAGT
jgi:hypothetical protein